MNQFEQRCNEQTIKVRGHEVTLFSPTQVKVTVNCPWPRPRLGQHPTEAQQRWFVVQSQNVVNYLLAEQIVRNDGGRVNVQIESEFAK